MSQSIRILYEDKHLTITDLYLIIKKYYMPLMTSKTILFTQMQKISIEDAKNVNNTYGLNTRYLNNWFQYDPDRKKKQKFIQIELKNSRIKPSVTPQDVDKAFDVLRKHFGQIDRKSVAFQSNRDKQTQVNQKQVHEMMKQQIQHEQKLKEEKQNHPHDVTQQQLTTKKISKTSEVKVQDVE